MYKKIIIAASIMLINIAAQAQDETDVLRLSQTSYGGTARARALGGAQGSIGADFTASAVNPAALGRYSKNEFTFSPSFKINNTTGTSDDNVLKADKTKFNFDNIGLVTTNRVKGSRNWKNTVFAIGMTRLADFNNNYISKVNNTKSSLANKYVESINEFGGINAVKSNNLSLVESYAFNAYLVDTANGKVLSGVNNANGIGQTKNSKTSGGINEINIALASNYQDNFLIGASVGIPIVTYNTTTTYSESFANSGITGFDEVQNIATVGGGINAKLGIVYMPSSLVRLGAAFHSPTYYSLQETSDLTLVSRYQNSSPFTQSSTSTPNKSDYNVTSSYKAILSGAFLIGRSGFITADYEYNAANSARLGFEQMDATSLLYENKVNNVVRNLYTPTNTLRIGAEVRANEFSLRGGFAQTGSPYNKDEDLKGGRTDISGGIGFRTNSFFIDLTLVKTITSTRNYYYVLNDGFSPNAVNKLNATNMLFTLGWKF